MDDTAATPARAALHRLLCGMVVGGVLAVATPSMAQTYPGSLGNTATVAPPGGVTDPDTGNNTNTDTNALSAVAALSVQKTVTSGATAGTGAAVSYRIDVANAGPSAALGATLSDIVPPQLTSVAWTCTASPGSSCGTASGSGNVALTINLAASGSLVLQVTGVAPSLTPATIGANTATITPPPGTTDPVPGDNTATTPTVPVIPRTLLAFADSAGPVDGTPGQPNVINVLANDTLNGVVVTAGQVVLTSTATAPLTINTNGAVDVAPGTPTGTYTGNYQICEAVNPGNCATAQVTVVVNASATVDAVDDVLPPRASGTAGSAFNVLANDTLNGSPVAGLVTLTAANAGPLLIAADGSATVAPGTPAGVYSANYQICESALPTNCDSASASVRVLAALVAADDATGPVNGSTGAVSIANVLDNDSAGGSTPAALGVVTLAGSSTAQIVFNADGSITVPPGTAAGTYNAAYTLCYVDAPTVCDSATVQLAVVTPGALVANPDSYAGVNGSAGAANVGNVLGNDTLDGAGISAGQVVLTPTNAGPVTIGTDGVVAVAAGTPAGSYTPGYQICETAVPDNCATTTATVVVATMAASPDALGPVLPGTLAGNVLANDFVDGAPAAAATATVVQTGGTPGFTISTDGSITIAAGTPAGSLTGGYQACQIAVPSICDTATVSIIVAAGTLITADDTFGPVNGATGGAATGNVLANDTLNGALVGAGQVVLTPGNAGPVTIATDGSVSIAVNTSAGTYTAGYQLCEVLNPANCDSAQVTVNVTTLVAVADTLGPVNGDTGGVAGNVLTNDRLDGAPLNPTDVVLTPSNSGPLTIGADGTVHVATGTAAGTYVASYQICQAASPTVCSGTDASVIVIVNAALNAVDDAFGPLDGNTGSANLGNVLANDTTDGAAIAPGSVTLISNATAPITIAADGTVSVPAGTAAGLYGGSYQICETANPANCDVATLTVNVRVAAALAANDDGPLLVNGATGTANAGNVLGNDTVNGAAIVPGSIIVISAASAPVTIAADGTISVAANATPGTYLAGYRICETAAPDNCDSAIVTLQVASMGAIDDTLGPAPPGGAAGNVLANDIVDGLPATSTTATVTQTGGAPGFTLAPDGSVTIAPGTPAGTLTGSYRACQIAQPTICGIATVSVIVSAATLAANDDALGPINGVTGGTVAGNVLANDTRDGAAVVAGQVVLAPTNAGPITIAADGSVSVAAGTPAGSYIAGYQLCEVLNPGNCDAAQVVIAVTTLMANDDALGPVNGGLGGVAGNVLTNDRLDGAPFAATAVLLTPSNNGPLTIGADGTVVLAAGTTAGTYTASYQICQAAQPSVCDGASVSVAVTVTAVLNAVDDLLGPVDGMTGNANAGNVLANDTLDGLALAPGSVTLVSSSSAPLVVAADGTVSVPAGTAAGVYSGNYRICETAHPGNCDTAVLSVVVSSLVANDDTIGPAAPGASAGNVLANDLVDGVPATSATVTLTQTGGAPGFTLAADGSVTIAPNTPAGTLTGGYRACQVAQPSICDTATISITVSAGTLAANDDTLGPVNGVAGGAVAGNVLGNDTLDGNVVLAGQVVLTPVSAGPVTIAADGSVTLAAGTAAGAYVASYQLCEAVNPGNCATAQVTVAVTTLVADDDALGPVNGSLGGVAGNVLTNDRLNGAPFATSAVVLTPANSGPLTIGTDGTVTVAPGTAAGTYTAGYQICEASQPTICDGASVAVTVAGNAAINAVDDAFGPADGTTGNSNLGNVLANDTRDGVTVTTGTVTLTSTASAPLSISPAGVVAIAPNTAAGVYSGSYQICETANPTNCDAASITVVVSSLAANDDTLGPVLPGGPAGNVLANDVVDGVPATPATVVLTQTSGAPGFTLAADGSVTVAPNTPAGTLTSGYRICQVAQPTFCDTATVSVTVGVGTLAANHDALGPVDGVIGGTVSGNVLANDTLNGSAVSAGQVVLTPINAGPVSIASDGSVSLAPTTAAGSYLAGYQLCETLNPTHCATAQVTVAVTTLVADDDVLGPVSGNLGGVAGNVLTNDRLNGAPFSAGAVVLTPTTTGPLSIGTDGSVSVAAATPAGTYTASYQICQAALPSVCDGASVSVTVAVNAVINAVDDAFGPVDGATGSTSLGNVLANDTRDGAAIVAGSITLTSTTGAPLTLASDGTLSVPAGTAAGVYSGSYQICDIANPANCDGATLTVVVSSLAANDDALGPVVPGAVAGNVLANDVVNGAPATPATVTLTQTGGAPGFTLAPNGVVTVAPNTPAGTLTGSYQACQVAQPTICDAATISITVSIGTLLANDDTLGPVDGMTGGAVAGNVLANDTLNAAAVGAGQVVLTPAGAGPVTIAPDGSVSIIANTPAGSYIAGYQLCEAVNPANCDTAQVIVVVTTLVADDDALGPVNGGLGGVAGNVLTNDRLDGAPFAAGAVVLTPANSGPLTIAANGTVTVAAGTTAGTYTAGYQICETAWPSICDSATVSVTVVASAAINAVDDVFGPVDGTPGSANLGNVLGNDTVDGAPINIAAFTLASTAAAPLSISPAGVVALSPNAPAGTYTATYTLCDAGDPGNCDTATVTVQVVRVDAQNDSFSLASGTAGGVVGNVLNNDALNGGTPNVVTAFWGGLFDSHLSIEPNGDLRVLAGTPAGTYAGTYTVCVRSAPSICDTATVTVTVASGPSTLTAANDTGSVDGRSGGVAVANVLANDTLAGTAPTTAQVVLSVVTPPANAGIVLDLASGAVTVAAGTPAGNYALRYRACEQAEPANCVEALAIIAVTAAAIDALDDAAGPVDAGALSVLNVLANDTLAGAPLVAGQVSVSVVTASPALILHADGRVDVVAGTSAGSYSATYRICEVLNPANCDQATVTIGVAVIAIDAVDDAAPSPVPSGSGGQAIANVTANDTLGGVAVSLTQVLLTQVSSTHANVQLNVATGAVTVAPRTPGGTHTLVYRLCERLNVGNCDEATVTVTVALPSLDAVDDAPAPVPGGNAVQDIVNVLTNDLYDGAPVLPDRVVLAPVTAGPLSLQADGTVDVAAGTPRGTYTLVYTLCDALTPGHCDSATVAVVVLATTLAVADDAAQTPQGEPLVVAVLANDTFAGAVPDPARVNVQVSRAPSNGTVVVQPDGRLRYTPAQYYSGQDSFQYMVCEIATPENCATATVIVTVLPNTVMALDDQVRTRTRTTVIAVLDNDTVSHAPLNPASLSVVRAPAHGEATCAQGTCTYVAATGFSGQDRFGYRVCDVSVPNAVCAEADVVIDVEAAPAVLRLAKRAAQRTAKVGDIVRYTIVIDNVGEVDARQVSLVDSLPPGFAVVSGSIQVGDADASGAPSIARPLRIDALDIPVGQRATVSYALRVGAGVGPGVHTNRAVMREADGATISNEATADVQVVGDPLLDDSLIIGTVFHDVDGDGTQDPGERGLAGVRVVSVEGLFTETDPHGRFHITGISGGRWARGRNFLLKVDVATLPAGARFTTENPRVLRITPGVPVRFDFGVQAPLPPPREAPSGGAACPDGQCGGP
ncbi:putative repeat protein (TIGR01451 family) [Pseudoxanthomonas japonensis]|uniref:Ig-like domain-containing protein n=1 Tax=Pseudoxanthomonas japonensis TaxID=69284 RepID=UPI00286447E0|nr:Ig-like domain-containing protein [Pseudoxanthomonas japonensis]MDR7070339.1 putative repeat protein (TIGR01451 family) [Pseudoxanthomonas japonensis]